MWSMVRERNLWEIDHTLVLASNMHGYTIASRLTPSAWLKLCSFSQLLVPQQEGHSTQSSRYLVGHAWQVIVHFYRASA